MLTTALLKTIASLWIFFSKPANPWDLWWVPFIKKILKWDRAGNF